MRPSATVPIAGSVAGLQALCGYAAVVLIAAATSLRRRDARTTVSEAHFPSPATRLMVVAMMPAPKT